MDLDEDADRLRMVDFWQSLRSWFEEQGYFLYECVDDAVRKRARPQPTKKSPEGSNSTLGDHLREHWEPIPDDCHVEDPFPYAFMGPGQTNPPLECPPYTIMRYFKGNVMYAQDNNGRHVALKIVKGGSDEYEVLRLLKDQPRLRDRVSFPPVVPILDLLPYNGDWFLVMPRWEEKMVQPRFFLTFQDAIQYIISLLEGLVFLHELRIFHRDIAGRKFLVNHFIIYSPAYLQSMGSHVYLQSTGAVKYAITDFDLAMVLDEKNYGPNPRLSIQETMIGATESRPYETMHAHVDFEPFKYDVACLGIYFAEHFQHIIVDVPLLAPLIDIMVTPNIRKRFTASEALAFAQNIPPTIPTIGRINHVVTSTPPYHARDRWAGLPEDFVKEWSMYRVNLFSWPMRLQNWFSQGSKQRWLKLYYYNYTISVLTFVPRFMLRHLLSLIRPIGTRFY